jgi:2,4-dienoyl-CoA reductase-like NADH-dependent reductase (Old Yellow Enzyme family)
MVRRSAFDEPLLRVEDAELTGIIEYGVDFLDVSSGASCPKAITNASPAYRASFAQAVKQAVGDNLTVWATGSITDDKIAQEILDKGQADVVLVERFSKRTRGLLGCEYIFLTR